MFKKCSCCGGDGGSKSGDKPGSSNNNSRVGGMNGGGVVDKSQHQLYAQTVTVGPDGVATGTNLVAVSALNNMMDQVRELAHEFAEFIFNSVVKIFS